MSAALRAADKPAVGGSEMSGPRVTGGGKESGERIAAAAQERGAVLGDWVERAPTHLAQGGAVRTLSDDHVSTVGTDTAICRGRNDHALNLRGAQPDRAPGATVAAGRTAATRRAFFFFHKELLLSNKCKLFAFA